MSKVRGCRQRRSARCLPPPHSDSADVVSGDVVSREAVSPERRPALGAPTFLAGRVQVFDHRDPRVVPRVGNSALENCPTLAVQDHP